HELLDADGHPHRRVLRLRHPRRRAGGPSLLRPQHHGRQVLRGRPARDHRVRAARPAPALGARLRDGYDPHLMLPTPMSSPPFPSSYDEVPYPSRPYPQAPPDRLATVATLLGMRPAPADHCRVLELGCGSGGNLIPLALTLPESTFVGIDLSGEQVAKGC